MFFSDVIKKPPSELNLKQKMRFTAVGFLNESVSINLHYILISCPFNNVYSTSQSIFQVSVSFVTLRIFLQIKRKTGWEPLTLTYVSQVMRLEQRFSTFLLTYLNSWCKETFDRLAILSFYRVGMLKYVDNDGHILKSDLQYNYSEFHRLWRHDFISSLSLKSNYN